MCDITSPDPKDTKSLGFPWCDGSETQRLSGQHPLLVPHGVSAAATIPKFSLLVCNCLFWLFFLDPSCAVRKGMGIIITGESQQWSPQAVLEPVQRELTLPFAAGAPEKAADPFCFFFSSKCLPSGGNESMTLQALVPFLWGLDPGQLLSLLCISSPADQGEL